MNPNIVAPTSLIRTDLMIESRIRGIDVDFQAIVKEAIVKDHGDLQQQEKLNFRYNASS